MRKAPTLNSKSRLLRILPIQIHPVGGKVPFPKKYVHLVHSRFACAYLLFFSLFDGFRLIVPSSMPFLHLTKAKESRTSSVSLSFFNRLFFFWLSEWAKAKETLKICPVPSIAVVPERQKPRENVEFLHPSLECQVSLDTKPSIAFKYLCKTFKCQP